MKISFIITYHNEPEGLLRECLESVFSLTLSDDKREVIVIDDGSECFPSSIYDTFGSAIRYQRQTNQGLSVARNTGLSLATGDYIQFVDADDALISDSYQRCIEYLRAHQETDILQFRHTTVRNSSWPSAFSRPMGGADYLLSSNLRPAAWGYLFRRACRKELHFTAGILHEDEEFTPLLFLQANNISSTDEKAYFYRQRETSITHQADDEWLLKRFGDFLGVMKRLRNRAEGLERKQQTALCWRVEQLAMNYVYEALRLCPDFGMAENFVRQLHDEGFFPIAKPHGELRFNLFRMMSRTQEGRRIIRLVIKLLPNGGKKR